MYWEDLYQRYCGSQQLRDRNEGNLQRKRLIGNICSHFPRDNSPELDWLVDALEDPQRKWFVAEILTKKSPFPRRLLDPMLRAAVMERDPSSNRWFVEPCVGAFGANDVHRHLLDYLINGTNTEKAGAARARYWAGRANPELEQEIRIAELTEFVRNDDLKVRQCLIPSLRLDPSAYPPELQDQVADAISIARSSDDEYIRHRVEMQLGAGGPFMALPKQ